MKPVFATLLLLIVAPLAHADDNANNWQRWIERDFPFFATVVDARTEDNPRNITPRGIVFHFGDTYVCWDVDLLRIAAIWTTDGEPFTRAGMAPNSYPDRLQKVPAGQSDAPKPRGNIWIHNGIYPGASVGGASLTDPRPPHPQSPDEVGRGGLPTEVAALRAIHYDDGGSLDYRVGNTNITERFAANETGITRIITVQPHEKKLSFVLAKGTPDVSTDRGEVVDHDGHRILALATSATPQTVRVTYARKLKAFASTTTKRSPRWPQRVKRKIPPFESNDNAAQLEPIPLPIDNPWRRGFRAAGVDFLSNGSAVVVTYDGDVWIGDRLATDARSITWRRFAAGLHEPLSVCVHREGVYVFDRGGIWRLRDTNEDGEADVHELVCAQIDQTAETREFASDMRIAPDGSFIICKPGQTDSTIARSSGAVLRISPDGRTVERLATGLRQPFLGLDTKTGRIAVSDQQGHYVPTTPVHILRRDAFYGFMGKPGPYPKPIAAPLAWIPHRACASASSIRWLHGKQFGPLDGACILVSYYQPGLLQIYSDEHGGHRQGAAARIPLKPRFPLRNGATNPADGMFYVTGFKIWGTESENVTGLARLRIDPKTTWPLPTKVVAAKRGVCLTFAAPLDPKTAIDPDRYEIDRWNYQRTPEYGSPHFKLDGSKGADRLPVSSVKLSKDKRSVFIGIPDMLEAMQVGVRYDITDASGKPIKREAFLTAHRLRKLDLTRLGFADNEVDLTGGVLVDRNVKPSLALGRKVYATYGCAACHSLDGSTEGKTGPSWKGLFNSKRVIIDGGATVIADAAYLRESIVSPNAKVAKGAVNGEAGMPAYAGVLSEAQIESLILLIESLSDKKNAGRP